MAGFGDKQEGGKNKPQRNNQTIGKALIKKAIDHHIQGDLKNAEKAYREFINSGFSNVAAFSNLGIICQTSQRTEEANALYKKAIQINSNHPDTYTNLGILNKDLGNIDQALAFTIKSLELKPDNPTALMNLGSIYKDLGNFDKAVVSTLKSLELNPDSSTAHMNLGWIYKDLGNFEKALVSTLKSLELNPDNSTAHMLLGEIHKDLGNLDRALASTLKSLELKPDDSKALYALGRIKMALGETQEARKNLLKSVENNPQEYGAYYELSMMLQSKEEAGELIKSIHSAKIPKGPPLDRSLVEFAISNCFHKAKNYDHASKYLQLANKSRLIVFPSNAESRQEEIANNLAYLQPSATMTVNKKSGKERIFIVGMPRSGSTLLETILSMNPEIKDLGESSSLKVAITKFHEQEAYNSIYQNLNEIYSQIEPINNAQVKYTTEKNLYNFVCISFIAFHMPAAKIIHCRRNPMDNILSMHRSNLTSGNSYTANIEDAAKVLIAQEKAMQIQKNRHPEKIFTFNYDQFVNEPEANLRKLLGWLDLEFNESYLHPEKSTRRVSTASVMQARKPISNKSVGGWKNYKTILKPALRILQESGIKIE